MKIYAAGKIFPHDWRETLIGERVSDGSVGDGTWGYYPGAVFDTHDYLGPFFIQGRHTETHGENQHGVGAALFSRDEDKLVVRAFPGTARTWYGSFEGLYQSETVERCCRAIRLCDFFYAWIDDPTCYGTLVEIGYAEGLAKKIFIAGPEIFTDLWFAYTMAERVILRDDPIVALRDLIALETPDKYESYLRSPEWDKKRRAKLKEAGYRCQLCNADDKPIHVHHRTYERKYNERPSDLIALCADCHAKFHDKVVSR